MPALLYRPACWCTLEVTDLPRSPLSSSAVFQNCSASAPEFDQISGLQAAVAAGVPLPTPLAGEPYP